MTDFNVTHFSRIYIPDYWFAVGVFSHIAICCIQNMVYYKISHVDGRITNPDQRIASDVPKFCSELSDLIQEDLTAVTDGVLYTWRLCSYASPKYVFWILVSLSPDTVSYFVDL